MNLKSKLFVASSAILFSASMAFGAITSDQLATQFQADGYSYITIKTGLTQIKVEAVKGGTLYEVIYDIETGATIDTSTHVIGPIDTPDPGVIVRTVARDFEDDHGGDRGGDRGEVGDDDAAGHDLGDDHGLDDDSADIDGLDDDSLDHDGLDDDGDHGRDHGGNSGGNSGRGSGDGDHGREHDGDDD